MNYQTFLKQEAGRKRLAKLLGIAPYRVDLVLTKGGAIDIKIDGEPASEEQEKVFLKDVSELTGAFKKTFN